MEFWRDQPSARNILILLFVIVCLIDLIYKKIFSIKYVNKQQAVLPYMPIIGSIFLLPESRFDLMTSLQLWIDRMKRPYYLWFFNRPYYLTYDADELKIILNNCLEKGYAYKYINMVITNSLLATEVSYWKKHRKLVSKSFSQKKLDSFLPIFNMVMDKHFDKYEQERKVDNLVEKNERLFLDNFLESICNFSFDTTTIDLTEFYKYDLYQAMKFSTHAVLKRILNPLLYPTFIYNLTSMGKKANQFSTYIENTIVNILHEKKDQQKINPEFTKNNNLMETILREYESEDAMINEVKLFGAAAAETSGTGLAAVLNILGMYPDIQEKVYQEVLDVVGTHGNVEYTHLLKMKYTEMVAMETLRLFPPVPMIVRKATADIDLGNGNILPNNTDILIPFISLHKCEKYWDNPSEFRPERFRPEEIAKRHPYAFLPFSAGARNCIGHKYSIMALKTAMAKAVLRFKIKCNNKTLDDIKHESFILLAMTGDMTCEFIPRK